VRELRDGEGVPGRPQQGVLRLLDPAPVAAEAVVVMIASAFGG
jgi:hypothetical protein